MRTVVLVSLLVAGCFTGFAIGSVSDCGDVVGVTRLPLPANAFGPDTLAFNQEGRGPFVGVKDGRILEYVNNSVGFVEFAVTSNNRPRIFCDASVGLLVKHICGLPLGLAFNKRTGELFVADTGLGFVVISPDGRNATLLANSAGGVPFRFLNGLDIDQDSGIVYLTDTSAVFSLSEIFQIILTRDRTGRLLSYNPTTKELRVLRSRLAGPNGVAVSRDGDSLVFTEIVTNTVKRFWLRGPKANTTELVATVEGLPDNVRTNAKGELLVATTLNVPELVLLPQGPVPVALRFSADGTLLQNVTFDISAPLLVFSDVNESDEGEVYLGLTTQDFAAKANCSST